MNWSAVVGAAVLLLSLSPLAVNSLGDYTRKVSYDGEIVVRCPDKNKATVQVLEKHSDVFNVGKESIDLRVDRATFQRVERYFPECTVLIQDLEAHMQEAEAQMFPVKAKAQEEWMKAVIQDILPKDDLKECETKLQEWEAQFQESKTWFEDYHDYNNIINWYKGLAAKHNNLVTYTSIGKSFEGRDMPALHITASEDANRKKVYMQCQIHAREWISGSVCMYFVNYLVQAYGKDPKVTDYLNSLEFLIIPFVNPDGFVYTWTTDRLWRKNRHLYPGARCTGVDINRNFPLGYKDKGLTDSCAEDYPGPRPESEVETRNIIKFFRSNSPIVGALDMHSYGQLILRPYGYTNQTAVDEKWMKELSTQMAAEIKKVHDQTYSPETSHELYPCYGIGADWFYSKDASSTNSGYRAASFCIELRDRHGKYGFVLPANQIIPTAEEVKPAILKFIEGVKDHPIIYDPSSPVGNLFDMSFRQ